MDERKGEGDVREEEALAGSILGRGRLEVGIGARLGRSSLGWTFLLEGGCDGRVGWSGIWIGRG